MCRAVELAEATKALVVDEADGDDPPATLLAEAQDGLERFVAFLKRHDDDDNVNAVAATQLVIRLLASADVVQVPLTMLGADCDWVAVETTTAALEAAPLTRIVDCRRPKRCNAAYLMVTRPQLAFRIVQQLQRAHDDSQSAVANVTVDDDGDVALVPLSLADLVHVDGAWMLY